MIYSAVANLALLATFVSCLPTPEPQQFLSGYATSAQLQQQQPQLSSTFPIVKRQSSGGYGYPNPNQQTQELDSAAQNFGDGSFARPNNYQGQSGGGGGGQASGSGNNVRCNRVGQGDTYRFQCEVTRKEDITLKYSHVLWLAGGGANAPAVEIVVPNYRVEEIIKAGFKSSGPGGKQPINILLQRPEKTVAAEVDVPTAGKIEPEVNIQYEPPTNTLVHYPNDQAYRPLSGPILPPARN